MRPILACLVLLVACDLPSGSLPPSITPFGRAHYEPRTIQPLDILVLARDGSPVAAEVHVVLDTAARRLGLQLGVPGQAGQPSADSIAVTSGANGLATIQVFYGSRSGRASLLMHAPSIGARGALSLTFEGGDATRIDLEPMLPLPVGTNAVVPWTTRDEGFNRVFGNPVLDVSNPAVATFVTESTVRGVAPGQTWVRGTLGAARDSILLTVVP